MKSLVQEAKTIAQAIDTAWLHAGKPENFSIKILEYPEKNFFGFNKKSAKIAFFFDEIKQPVAQSNPRKQPYKPQQQRPPVVKNSQAAQAIHSPKEEQKIYPQQKPVIEKTKQPEKIQSTQVQSQTLTTPDQTRPCLWNNEHVETIRTWVYDMLKFMNRSDINFTVNQNEFIITIAFEKPIIGATAESAQERKIFTHFSLLLMTILKKQYRSAFRGHRILFTHQQ